MAEERQYILGTDTEELHRLGFQHRVWAQATFALWQRAGYTRGQTILDLGCGPGYDAIDLAHIVGAQGKVIAVDKSEGFLEFIRSSAHHQQLENIECQLTDFHEMKLQPSTLDGAYARWALCWVNKPELIIQKVADALKPGAAFAVQEYFNWGAMSVRPKSDAHIRVVNACLESWKQSEGEINVGGEIPSMFQSCGLRVTHMAPLSRIGRPGSIEWQWVTTFLHSYIPRLIMLGLLSEEDNRAWQAEWAKLEQNPSTFLFCPQMIEVLGIKI